MKKPKSKVNIRRADLGCDFGDFKPPLYVKVSRGFPDYL
jgi:hypothetical protein